MMAIIRKVISALTAATDDDLVHRVEDMEERNEDVKHDLYVVRQRTDTLYRLVASMQEDQNNVQ